MSSEIIVEPRAEVAESCARPTREARDLAVTLAVTDTMVHWRYCFMSPIVIWYDRLTVRNSTHATSSAHTGSPARAGRRAHFRSDVRSTVPRPPRVLGRPGIPLRARTRRWSLRGQRA